MGGCRKPSQIEKPSRPRNLPDIRHPTLIILAKKTSDHEYRRTRPASRKMSQLDLEGAVEAQTGMEASAGFVGRYAGERPDSVVSPTASVLRRPSVRPLSAVRSTAARSNTYEFPVDQSSGGSVDRRRRPATRAVASGSRYLAQQLLTCGPLVIVDLLLLIAVIVIARQTLIFAGGRSA